MASVSDLLLEQARQAGEARRQRGALIGQSVAQIGQIPGQIIQGREDEQRRNTALALQQQEARRKALADAAAEARAGRTADLAELRYADEQHAQDHKDAIIGAVNIADHGYPPDAVDAFVRDLARHTRTPEEKADLADRSQTPEGKKAVIDGLIALAPAKEPKYQEFDPTKNVYDVTKPIGTAPVLTGTPKITYGAPQPMMVGGQRVPVRPGSDGKLYDLKGQIVTADVAPDVPPPPAMTPQQIAADAETKRHNLVNEGQAAAALKDKSAEIDITPNIQTTASGKKYLDLSLFTGETRNKASKAAGALGIPTVSKEDSDTLKVIDNSRASQKDILGQIDAILPKDATGRIVDYPGRRLSAILQTNEQRAAFATWRAAAIQTLKATAGAKGLRINQAEIAQAVENDIPTLNDTLGVARTKNANINKMLDNAERPIVDRDRSAPAAGKTDPLGIR